MTMPPDIHGSPPPQRRTGPVHLTGGQKVGLVLGVVLCGLPAMELNGFGFGIPITLDIALLCAIVGGAVGGMLICPKPLIAGLVGGLLAGPAGLLALYYYTRYRGEVWDAELVFVQLVASLPGVGIGYVLKKMFTQSDEA